MIGLYRRNPLRNSSTAVFRSQNLCRSTRSTFYGEAISKCLSDVSSFLAVRCSLLPLFFAPLSFVFNSLQPLLAKIRGVGGGRPPTVWFHGDSFSLKPPAKSPLRRHFNNRCFAFLKTCIRLVHFEFLVQTLPHLQEKRPLPNDLRRTLHHHSAHVLPAGLVHIRNQRHNAMMLQIGQLRGIKIRRPVNLIFPDHMANRRNLWLAIPVHRSYSNHRSITQKFHLLRFRPRHIILPVSFDEMTARPAWTLSSAKISFSRGCSSILERKLGFQRERLAVHFRIRINKIV